MKNFAKKLALFLAFAMVVTMVHPFSVSAASKITLKSGAAAPSTIYAGHTYNLKVKGTAVKFYTSNKKIATIGATTGKMKAVAPGSVKITAKNKKTGKAVASKTFKVLQRAKSVAVDSELFLGAVGDTAKLTATLTPATSTDVVRFTTSDKTIATVGLTSGKVTAKAEGTTTINVYAKATKATSNSNKYNKVATVKVYVGPYMDSAKQTTVTDVEVAFKTDVKEVKATDFVITNDTTKAVFPVKAATISKTDAKVVTLSTYAELKDAATYTVTYGKTSAQFTATDGKVASIAIEPTVVTVQNETKLYVVAKDANGIQVGKYDKAKADFPSNLEFTVETSDGYVTGENALYLNSKTSTAKAKAIYHTYKYETVDGVQTEVGKIETGDVTITATDAAAISNYQYTIAKTAPAWTSSSFKAKTDICVGDNDEKVFFNFADAAKNEVSDYTKYEISSTNEDVLLVTASDLANKNVSIAPIKAGTVYLTVKNASTKAVITTLAITVKEEAKAANLVLDKTNVSVSKEADAADVVNVGYKVVDQYNNNMNVTLTTDDITVKSCPNGADAVAAKGYVTIKDANIVVNAAGATKGTYVYEVKYNNKFTKYLTVNVKEAVGAEGFDLLLSETSKDAVVKTEADRDKFITIKPVMTKGGVACKALVADANELTGVSTKYENVKVAIKVLNSKGEEVKDVIGVKDNNVIAFNVTVSGKAIAAGTYTVSCEFTAKTVATATVPSKNVTFKKSTAVTITNTQLPVSFERVEKTVAATVATEANNAKVLTAESAKAIVNGCYTFTYDNTKYGKNGTEVDVVANTCSYVSSTYVAFKTVTIEITVANGVKAQITVDLAGANTVNVTAPASAAPVATSAAPTTSEAPAATSEAPTTSEAPAATSAAPSETVTP